MYERYLVTSRVTRRLVKATYQQGDEQNKLRGYAIRCRFSGKMSQSIKNLLIECKERTAPSTGCKNITIRTYLFFCGRKNTIYQGFVILGLATLEILRQYGGMMIFQQLLAITAFVGASPYAWTVGTYGDQASIMLDDVIWVAGQVEQNVPRKVAKRNKNVVRLTRVYFWYTLWACLLTLAPMIVTPYMEGITVLPTPLPDAETVGEPVATIAHHGMSIWQSIYFTLIAVAYSWVDGLHFGSILIIYALTKMVSQCIRAIDFSRKEDAENIIRAHQILLKAANFCNEAMSVTLCTLTVISVYLSVVTVYALIVDNAPIDRILDVFFCSTAILRYGYMSEMIQEASTEISSAVYESPWLESLFADQNHALSTRHTIILMSMRAQLKPMTIRVGILGSYGHAFSVKYCRALYSYFQALENLV